MSFPAFPVRLLKRRYTAALLTLGRAPADSIVNFN